ncbi:MAG: ORF6N domain-containing protein [Chitinophagaceae bacterium]|nr:ORF6N domain-containing protein [Chitinophagaceae bacterium]
MQPLMHIQDLIYEIREQRVMLDRDLARLYGVPTKSLNLAVKRNIDRFPADFMFRLNKEETHSLRFQFETSKRGGDRYQPWVFTELGVAMLSSVLNSPPAIQMNILIMRTFFLLRRNRYSIAVLAKQIADIHQKVGNHQEQIALLYEAFEKFLDTDAEQKSWSERERIGFVK